MQSASALLASAPKVSSSVPVTPGASRPIYLTDAQSAELAFRRANGIGRRYLNLFPRRFQVLAGTITTIGVGAGLFFALRPGTRTVHHTAAATAPK